MLKKTAYIALAVFILLSGFFAYHFVAANNAERTLDESIQEIAQNAGAGLTISYSSIEVSPFSGDILFSDVNIIRDQNIQRAATARFDLTYGDFLNFMIWGTEAGLREVRTGALQLSAVSYTNRNSYLELKVDSLQVDYSGNLWNLIVLGATRQSAEIQHHVQASGTKFRYYQPETGIGSIQADSVDFSNYFGQVSPRADSLYNSLNLSSITWGPPADIQKKYEFFIRGFGYETDSIPFRHASGNYLFDSQQNQLTVQDITIDSELFSASLSGDVRINEQQFSQSVLDGVAFRIHNMSDRFSNFLLQLEKLMGLQLPGSDGQFRMQLQGPVEKPKISYQ